MSKSVEFKSVIKYCIVCDTQLKLNNNRDIVRKRFCSQICNGIHSTNKLKKKPNFYKNLIKLMNTPEANSKKGRSGANNPRWIKDRSKIKSKRCFYEERQFMKEIIKERNSD